VQSIGREGSLPLFTAVFSAPDLLSLDKAKVAARSQHLGSPFSLLHGKEYDGHPQHLAVSPLGGISPHFLPLRICGVRNDDVLQLTLSLPNTKRFPEGAPWQRTRRKEGAQRPPEHLGTIDCQPVSPHTPHPSNEGGEDWSKRYPL